MTDVATAVRAGILLSLLASALLVWRLDGSRGRWGDRLRSRLLLGVPWGTLVVICGVLADYLLLQGGLDNWLRPVALPFASWSYLYPLGVITAAFSHQSASHLLGNLLSTVALAPLAEYAFGHFPRRRGAAAFASLRTNPYARAFLVFPLGVALVGLATVLFQWGPVIGFSGVVFAFAGFALVRFPVATVVAVTARGLVDLLYDVLQDPIVEATAGPGFSAPWWADVAVQGHLLGFLLGVTIGAAAVGRERRASPSALRVWLATAVVGSAMSLWIVWWYRGAATYVLHRGLGAVLIVVVALLAALAARGDRETPSVAGVPARRVGVALLLVGLLVMAAVAVPINLSTVDEMPPAEESVAVRDYRVTYAEGVYNPKLPVINVSVFGERTRVQTGGVIVVSDRRELWSREYSPARLAFDGTVVVRAGGAGWRREVLVRRRGWSAVGGDTAYQIWIWPRGGNPKHVFVSGNATARPVLAGKNVTVVPRGGQFFVAVTAGNRTLDRAPIPRRNSSVTLAGVRLVHRGPNVVAVVDGTRVRVLREETYE